MKKGKRGVGEKKKKKQVEEEEDEETSFCPFFCSGKAFNRLSRPLSPLRQMRFSFPLLFFFRPSDNYQQPRTVPRHREDRSGSTIFSGSDVQKLSARFLFR